MLVIHEFTNTMLRILNSSNSHVIMRTLVYWSILQNTNTSMTISPVAFLHLIFLELLIPGLISSALTKGYGYELSLNTPLSDTVVKAGNKAATPSGNN